MIGKSQKQSKRIEEKWVNVVGGYGDALMVSGVLKLAFEQNPQKKYKLVRRTRYTTIFKGHPAIEYIGFPPRKAKIIRTEYWAMDEWGRGKQRIFQILARSFGLSTPVKEELFLPGEITDDKLMVSVIPWRKKNIIIAPSSDSPRKMMSSNKWQTIVDKLLDKNILVIQVGREFEKHIRGTYSLLGLTSPHQLVSLLKKVDLVVTLDNFIMHAAHLAKTKAIVLFGPTDADSIAYNGQILLKAPIDCDKNNICIGSPNNCYSSPCPLSTKDHCMNKISEDNIFSEIVKII